MLPPPKKYEGDYNRDYFVKALRRCWINDCFSVALIAAMTLLSGAGFTASVASADTDTVGYETDRIAFSGARTVCGEYSIDFAALTRSRMFLIDGGRRGTEGA